MEASEAQPTTPDAQVTSSEPQATPQESSPSPDVSSQLQALTQEFQDFRSQVLPQQPEQPVYDQLAGYGQQPFTPSAGEGQQQYVDPGYDPSVEADPYEETIRERVAEATFPILQTIEMDRRRDRLDSLAQTHPELKDRDFQEAITDRLAPMAERYGNEMILTDPDLIETALIAEKAARATANEVPAEQAVTQGARVESNAGAAAPEAELTPEQEIELGMLRTARRQAPSGPVRDIFT